MTPDPDPLPPDARADVLAALAELSKAHGVRVPLAVESGSRAWGFASPDSDYDCRFVFVRLVAAHLTPWPARDVIEAPITGLLDVNGWELGKAIKLLLGGSAVIVEWLRSPLTYAADPVFRGEFLDFALRHADRGRIAAHYLHLGLRQRRTYLNEAGDVPLKKLFYALRPAVALRWLRTHPGEAVAPMALQTLMAESDPPAEIAVLVAELVARKAMTREMGGGPVPPSLPAFVDAEFAAAATLIDGAPGGSGEAARGEAVAFYRRWVERLDAD